MRVKAITTFLHGRARLVAGQTYEVPERVGGYFLGNGWVEETTGGDAQVLDLQDFGADAPRLAQADATLEIDNGVSEQSAPNVGE